MYISVQTTLECILSLYLVALTLILNKICIFYIIPCENIICLLIISHVQNNTNNRYILLFLSPMYTVMRIVIT